MVPGHLAIHMQRDVFGLLLLTLQKFNSKWITVLNIRAKAEELAERNMDTYLHDFWSGKDFLDRVPKAQVILKYFVTGLHQY